MSELNRITSHLVWLGTSGLELGAITLLFYTYRERILRAAHVAETETTCALVAETSLAAPAINTGRSKGGVAKQAPAAA